MNRSPVRSSNLASVGYDPGSNTLEVGFRDGGVYRYFGVPESKYRALMSVNAGGGSVGSYFHAHIRDYYPCARLHG